MEEVLPVNASTDNAVTIGGDGTVAISPDDRRLERPGDRRRVAGRSLHEAGFRPAEDQTRIQLLLPRSADPA